MPGNKETSPNTFGDQYALAAGKAGHDRLRLLCELHDPATHRLLQKVGVGPGKSFVEFACGLGYISRWASSQGAVVTGVDLSEERIDEARALAAKDGIDNLEFRQADIYDHDLPRNSTDFAYCRFVLVHLSRPLDTLRGMAATLKPGGRLVCEEPDLSTLFAEPPSEAYKRVLELGLKAGRQRDVDYELERKLHVHARAAGSLTEEQSEALFRGMQAADEDPNILVGHCRFHQLVARLP